MRISDWSSDVCSSDLLWRECRAAPARSPKRLSRLEHHREFVADGSADAVLSRGAEFLRRRRYRVVLEDTEVRAEKGYLREVGNLVFHLDRTSTRLNSSNKSASRMPSSTCKKK